MMMMNRALLSITRMIVPFFVLSLSLSSSCLSYYTARAFSAVTQSSCLRVQQQQQRRRRPSAVVAISTSQEPASVTSSLVVMMTTDSTDAPVGDSRDTNNATTTAANTSPLLTTSSTDSSSGRGSSTKSAFDAAVLNRYACKRFRRFDGTESDKTAKASATTADPGVVRQALHCLELARQAPSAFNTQPYKLVLVASPAQKAAVARYCLGPNKRRVLDADCTAVFLADRQVLRTLPRYRAWTGISSIVTRIYITLFSSGYPFPRFLAATISFFIRTGVAVCNVFTNWLLKYPLPTLASAETWSAKQVMLVAMTYMLGCSARGIATIPMEGINARGIRTALKIPSRYAIPLIVSTGYAYEEEKEKDGDSANDKSGRLQAERAVKRRYPMDEVIYGDLFGQKLNLGTQ